MQAVIASAEHRPAQAIPLSLAARLSIVEAQWLQGHREEAIQTLSEAEAFLFARRQDLAPGIAAINWLNLVRLAQQLHLVWAAQRFLTRGLEVDPSFEPLLRIQAELDTAPELDLTGDLEEAAQELRLVVEIDSDDPAAALTQLHVAFRKREQIWKRIELVGELISELLRTLTGTAIEPAFIEDLAERADANANVLLPDRARTDTRRVLSWIATRWGIPKTGQYVEIEAHEDLLWPREDDREACCTLQVIVGKEVGGIRLLDSITRQPLWISEAPSTDQPRWVRWLVSREDGFIPDDTVEMNLLVETAETASDGNRLPYPISVTVASEEPRWPIYSTGALTPEEVIELYGREDILDLIVRNLGPRRAAMTLFLEAPRRMGKTSILRFAAGGVPDHVCAVYVNLERDWGGSDARTFWKYMAAEVSKYSGIGFSSEAESPSAVSTVRGFVSLIVTVCSETRTSYVLLLLDEFHVIIDRSRDAEAILSELRAFHDDPNNRISMVMADRLTRRELERQQPHDLWAQLTSKSIGPLDLEAVRKALRTPPVGGEQSDVYFPQEAIERLYEATSGYPYHVVWAARSIVDQLWKGPWLVATPQDVEEVVCGMEEQDELFQVGLCRPDRIDVEIQDAVSALLEWDDLRILLSQFSGDLEWRDFSGWSPAPIDFLAGLGRPEELLQRLSAIGIIASQENQESQGGRFFSPLLLRWLRRMREERRSLGLEDMSADWALLRHGDGARVDAASWAALDAGLIQRCREAGLTPPLKPHTPDPGFWSALARDARSAAEFRSTLDACFSLFVDGREEKKVIRRYPYLFLAYHEVRLVRNYHVHRKEAHASSARAWSHLCTRVFGRGAGANRPSLPEEWSAVRGGLLRKLYAALRNAIETVGSMA